MPPEHTNATNKNSCVVIHTGHKPHGMWDQSVTHHTQYKTLDMHTNMLETSQRTVRQLEQRTIG